LYTLCEESRRSRLVSRPISPADDSGLIHPEARFSARADSLSLSLSLCSGQSDRAHSRCFFPDAISGVIRSLPSAVYLYLNEGARTRRTFAPRKLNAAANPQIFQRFTLLQISDLGAEFKQPYIQDLIPPSMPPLDERAFVEERTRESRANRFLAAYPHRAYRGNYATNSTSDKFSGERFTKRDKLPATLARARARTAF